MGDEVHGNPLVMSLFSQLFKNIYLFIYLAVPGLSCSTWDLLCGMRALSCGMQTLSCSMHVGSSSLTRDRTRAPCIGTMDS